MNNFLKGVINFIEDDRGAKSSKRISGIFLIMSGGFSKLSLIAYGAKIKLADEFTLYDKIDSTIDSMLYIGAALLTGAMIEKFRKKSDAK